MDIRDLPIWILDGACGTNLQAMDIPASAWDGRDGCNEWLNVTAPDVIQQLHASFLSAGSNAVETNTFGASSVVLAEYDLSDQVETINTAAVANARAAIQATGGAGFVVGSIGPTTKLPSLGHIEVDALADAIGHQARTLIDAGADALIIETCQDLLQARTGVIAAQQAMTAAKRDVPLLVSITIEMTGTMLVGADIAAAVAVLEPLGVFSLGLNCATGPLGMESHIRYLSQNWPRRISVIPNAGLPTVENGKTCYKLSPVDYAAAVRQFVEHEGVSIVGGCCGTTPGHIAELVKALDGVAPKARDIQWRPQLASGYQAVDLHQDPPPLMIGERANANGSKKFREMLLADDFQGCLKVATDQEAAGSAQALDLCVAYAGRDESADMTKLLAMVSESCRLPVVIDSTTSDVIEAALRRYPGRAIINSINLEDGGANLDRVCTLARTYGAACIALTIGPDGMAMTADEKLAIAKDIYDRAVGTHGLRPYDLIFDVLTFTIGSGDANLRTAAIETLEGIRKVKAALPGVLTTLGLSNISFGLSPASRKVLNSLFLHEAIQAGLDTAIVDASKIVPVSQLPEADRQAGLNLIYNRATDDAADPLAAFIEHFSEHVDESETPEAQAAKPAEQVIQEKLTKGDREGLEDIVEILLQRHRPVAIINDLLIPAMRQVGEMFGRGDMLLPFVLQSAEVMKRTVDLLEPHMDQAGDEHNVKVLLATVAGDVHDIGKNLVDIILSNNGYKVFNIGIKIPAEQIIAKAKELDVDVIGLSGLLVKSAIVMKESMPQFAEAGLTQPVLLGGAALTRKFVAEDCVPDYAAPVVYCPDAFAGLAAMQKFEAGQLAATDWQPGAARPVIKPGARNVSVARTNDVPTPPFWGARHVTDIDPEVLFRYVNEQALFRGRWGYRRGKMNKAEYDELIATKVRPTYEDLIRRSTDEGLIQPRVAYGYFRCRSNESRVIVDTDDATHTFDFPRQADAPHLCISDFFHTADEGGDVAGFFVVSIGPKLAEITRTLFEGDEYHDYLLMHAFGVEVTDALAEYWHEVMRGELGYESDRPDSLAGYAVQEYRGSRYGFGYPACPDLDAHRPVFDLLKPEAIGIELTDNMQMVPEMSTSAIVAHHPQAKYFAV